MPKGTLNESVQVVQVQEGKLVRCPNCGATRWHPGEYVELRQTVGGLTRQVAFTEYRCLGCNSVYSEQQLLG